MENSEVEIGKATGLFSLGTINYCPLYQFDNDIRQTRIYLLRKAEENVPLNQLEQSIVDYNNAIEFSKGDYPYEIIYRLPGKKTVSEKVKAKFVYKK